MIVQTGCISGLKLLRLGILLALLITMCEGHAQKKHKKNNAGSDARHQLFLSADGASRYRIVIPSAATASEQKASEVLKDYFLQISGAALAIVTADKDRSPYEIVLGQNERLDELSIPVNFNMLGEDGFVIRTDSARLIIAGGSGEGTLYGVYTFLEEYLGCRMYTPQVKVIPRQEKIQLQPIKSTHKDNFFNRASAIAFLGYVGTLVYHSNAGGIYDEDGEEKK